METLAAAIQAADAQGKGHKSKKNENYEYDSDEDVEGGTWEHKKRSKEMRETEGNGHSVYFCATLSPNPPLLHSSFLLCRVSRGIDS